MFKKKIKIKVEIEEEKLKTLKLYESIDGNYNDLGFAVSYTRVHGGIIRTIINTESMSQLFIPLSNVYFN